MTLLRFLLGWSAIYLALTCAHAMACEASTLARHRRGPRDRRHTVRRSGYRLIPYPAVTNRHALGHRTLHLQPTPPDDLAAWAALEGAA